MSNEQLQTVLFNNPWLQWLFVIALTSFLSFLIKLFLKVVESRFARYADRSQGRLDNIILDCLAHTKSWAIFIWVLNPLIHIVDGNPGIYRALTVVTVVLSTLQVAIWGLRVLRGLQEEYIHKRVEKDPGALSALNLMGTAVKGLFVISLFLICLSNLGVDIGALIAGLGIGGIAVALAAQNILGDLFGSLSIVLDKPFIVGDFIVVGTQMGTVEYVGIKTTRLRSLSGEELIFSNKDLLESRIQNFKRMRERRVVFKLQVPYSTPLQKLQQIPGWIKSFVEEKNQLSFERSHLSGYGSSSYEFETVFWVKDPDFNLYMDLQQEVFHQIIQRFSQERVQFALPTQVWAQNAPDAEKPEKQDSEMKQERIPERASETRTS